MSRLPDRFDLLVRKMRERESDPQRQLDFLLAAFFTLKEAHLLNAGGQEDPRPRFVQMDALILMPVFSSADQADSYTIEQQQRSDRDPLGLISMPPLSVLEYAQEWKGLGCEHWFVNPGPYGFIVSVAEAEFYQQQRAESAQANTMGFWISNPTAEEEAFWEDHGL
jgi:hypothetical protein